MTTVAVIDGDVLSTRQVHCGSNHGRVRRLSERRLSLWQHHRTRHRVNTRHDYAEYASAREHWTFGPSQVLGWGFAMRRLVTCLVAVLGACHNPPIRETPDLVAGTYFAADPPAVASIRASAHAVSDIEVTIAPGFALDLSATLLRACTFTASRQGLTFRVSPPPAGSRSRCIARLLGGAIGDVYPTSYEITPLPFASRATCVVLSGSWTISTPQHLVTQGSTTLCR